jgi:hypothetical protein
LVVSESSAGYDCFLHWVLLARSKLSRRGYYFASRRNDSQRPSESYLQTRTLFTSMLEIGQVHPLQRMSWKMELLKLQHRLLFAPTYQLEKATQSLKQLAITQTTSILIS